MIHNLLRSVGVEPRDVGIRAENLDLMVGRRPRAELAHLLMCEPLRADGLAYMLATQLTHGARQSPLDVLGEISRYNGRVVRRGLVGDPLAKQKAAAEQDGALATALERCGARDMPRAELAALPKSIQQTATVLVLAAADSAAWVRRARRGASEEFWKGVEERMRRPLTAEEEPQEPEFDLEYKRVVEEFPAEAMMVAAQDLLFAVGYTLQALRADASIREAKFYVEVETELGWVVLADAQSQEHAVRRVADTAMAPLLVLDVGGDDRYENAGANGGLAQPISLALDLGGNDVYRSSETALGSFGAGTFGVGLLWDDAGNDSYDGYRRSQSAGYFGVGVLVDQAGDDAYESVHASQGGALAGYGVLIDRAGDDRYETYLESQAFAGPNAAAVLIDLDGNDRYVANDLDIRFPSSQNPQHNNSMAQGCGIGWRADYLDGVSIHGGVAILVDAAGDDEYVCGLFGQGAGYWYGAGLLLDGAGDDQYTGHWYVQGAAAHYAAGLLVDRAGNDRYTANQNMSQGAGHDLSVGVLIDDEGDDLYRATTLGLGASNAAGVGLFVDKAGDDRYCTPPGNCLGWVNPNQHFRGLFPSFGLFFDLGGQDVYRPREDGGQTRSEARNGARWVTPPDPNAVVPYVFGYAFDL